MPVPSAVDGVVDAPTTVAVVTAVERVAETVPEIEAVVGTVVATVMARADVERSTTAGGAVVAQGRVLMQVQVAPKESGVEALKENVTDPIAVAPVVAAGMQSVVGLRTSGNPVALQVVAIDHAPSHIATTRNVIGKRTVQPPTAGVPVLMKRNLGRSAKTIARNLGRNVTIAAEAVAIAVKR